MIKDWILKRKFVFEYVQDQIRGAEISFHTANFANAQKDVLETMADDLEKRANELAEKKLADMLSVVNPRAIVSVNKQQGAIYIGAERPDAGRLNNLKQEAEYLLKSDIWHLIYETPKELAQRSMFVAGETLVDMQKGKSMLFTLATQKNILDTFKSYKPKPLAVAE